MSKPTRTIYERTIAKGLSKNVMAKSLAHFIFREVIEDAHTKYNIAQDEMMAMSKKAVNRAAAFLSCLDDDELMASLAMLLSMETTGWDNPKETADTRSFLNLAKREATMLRSIKGKSNREIYSDNL